MGKQMQRYEYCYCLIKCHEWKALAYFYRANAKNMLGLLGPVTG